MQQNQTNPLFFCIGKHNKYKWNKKIMKIIIHDGLYVSLKKIFGKLYFLTTIKLTAYS